VTGRARRRDSRAYVLRQVEDGSMLVGYRWYIVNRSGPSRITAAVRFDEPDDETAREQMEADAARRQAVAERVAGPEAHVLFVAVTGDELAEFGVRAP
jgi:hypothetical protein